MNRMRIGNLNQIWFSLLIFQSEVFGTQYTMVSWPIIIQLEKWLDSLKKYE